MISNGQSPAGRLRKLEAVYRPACVRCGGWPTRVVIEDLETGATAESMPSAGCPVCGRQPRHTVHIVGDD